MTITREDFRKVDVRVGTLKAIDLFPEARRPAYQLTIDFGPEIGVKRSSAQIAALYRPQALIGRQVAAVVNLPPKRIGSFVSEVLVLGFPDERGSAVLVMPERRVPNGGRLF